MKRFSAIATALAAFDTFVSVQSAYPAGYVYPKQVTPMQSCPKSYEPVGKSCISVKYADPSKKCAKGKLDGKLCIEKEYAQAIYDCPNGFTMKGHKCEAIDQQPASPYCEKDYDLLGDKCVKNQYYEVYEVCPDGHSKKDDICSTKDYEKALYKCPQGFIEDSKKDCVSVSNIPAEVTCPADYILKNNNCVLKKIAAKESKCPKGYKDYSGQCVKFNQEKAVLVCPPNHVEKGHKCIYETLIPQTPYCPKETVLQGNVCVKMYEKEPKKFECPSGFKMDHGGECIAVEKIEATSKCMIGQDDGKKKCITQEFIEPDVKCLKDSGNLEKGSCVKQKTTAPKVSCPKGFKKAAGKDGICTKTIKAKAEFRCPPGSEMHAHKCTAAKSIAVSYECKSGYEFFGGHCVKRLIGKSNVVCPKEYKLVDGNTCQRKFQQEAKSICAHGSSKKGDKCVEYLKPYAECPKKFSLDSHGKCIQTETAQMEYTCPAGALLSGHECQRVPPLGETKGKANTVIDWFNQKFRV